MNYFKNSYEYRWSKTNDVTNFIRYQNAAEDINISFETPILTCYGCLGSGWSPLFQMNVITKIYRTQTQKRELLGSGMYRYEDIPSTKEVWKTFHSGPTSISNANNATYYAYGGKAYLIRIRSESKSGQKKKAGSFSDYYTTTDVLAEVRSENHKTIEFTIPSLSQNQIEAGVGYKYEIECVANPVNTSAMMGYYEATFSGYERVEMMIPVSVFEWSWTIRTNSVSIVDASSCKITATMYHQDMTITSDGGPLITKGVKYSAYQLLRKALLTCDTYILDNETTSLDKYGEGGTEQPSLDYPIILDNTWNNRLQVAKINETIFEVNNLWEVLLQIGYYLHAIPYLEFAEDGTDRFVLKFKQLGATKLNEGNSTKITIFNSRNLSEYYTQYDSYVTNLFSPQNLIEEWVVPKTSDSSFLTSNETAELHLSSEITELVEFNIAMQLPNNQWDIRPALDFIFEKSVYDTLSNDNPYQVFPSKGSSLYYNLGDNKILGLSFVPPCASEGDLPMALKRIVQLVWQGTEIPDIFKLKFNSLIFHVKYRTQDTARINQFRPNLEDFMKNSSLEKYPHHEQFYNQEGKIIDSERYSANLYGKLIRVGNCIYQRQEYPRPGEEKESGDLVMIGHEAYYVTSVENEFYEDAMFQKVTYSKDFNQLSNIVTIPSEPRFYEVSERSKIARPVRTFDFFTLSTIENTTEQVPKFLNNSIWQSFIKGLIFNDNRPVLPNYAWTRFAVDKKRERPYPDNQMFPSSLLERTGPTVRPASSSDHTDVIVPLIHYPLHDGIVFKWKMFDNFKAGDFIDTHIYYDEDSMANTVDKAYLSQQPVRYVDIYGRADLYKFKLFEEHSWTFEEAQKLPLAVKNPPLHNCVAGVQGNETTYLGLDKDCREELSFNYQINLLHRAAAGDDDFITFPNLFGEKEPGKLKIAILNQTQSQFNENQNITDASILADSDDNEIDYDFFSGNHNSLEIRFSLTKNIDLSEAKSIVLYQGDKTSGKFAYIVKNISKLNNANKLQSWWIYPVFTN